MYVFCVDCLNTLTNEEVEYLEYRCLRCEELYLIRVNAWKKGAEDLELDAKFNCKLHTVN